MKKLFYINHIVLFLIILLILFCFTGCKKTDDNIKYPQGIFPDTIINMSNINSAFDDYNTTLYQLNGYLPIIFSSNRKSAGFQFDLEQGFISFTFDQTNANFELETTMTNDEFLNSIINKAQTSGNDFGPYQLFSSLDGQEYTLVSSENGEGKLDLFYLRYAPYYGTYLPEIYGPNPVKLLNTNFDDAYFCFDLNQDSAYFSSNPEGNFDIFLKRRPSETDIASWFDLDYSVPVKVDSINSPSDDMCPIVYHNVMVFTSNRPGGLDGYDLYYSIFRNGNWSSPVNFGPDINTSSNEYRPLIGYHPDFLNTFMIFSSDRPGGKGKFDLYFSGFELPE